MLVLSGEVEHGVTAREVELALVRLRGAPFARVLRGHNRVLGSSNLAVGLVAGEMPGS